jgi:hypothetical protein
MAASHHHVAHQTYLKTDTSLFVVICVQRRYEMLSRTTIKALAKLEVTLVRSALLVLLVIALARVVWAELVSFGF